MSGKNANAAAHRHPTLATLGELAGHEVVADFEKKLEAVETEVRTEKAGRPEEEIEAEISSRSLHLLGEVLNKTITAANLNHKYFKPTSVNYWLDKGVTALVTTVFAVGGAALALKLGARKVEAEPSTPAIEGHEGNLFNTASERPIRTREAKTA